MKKILITGANSYIGTSFEKYVSQWPDKYQVDTIDMIDGSWRGKSFEGYDVVYHVAGIAHIKETKKNAHLYYEVNRDLPIEVAKKAKEEGAKQFIFLSSGSVYGMESGVITRETKPKPKSFYGKSKLQAEQLISDLECKDFRICLVRPLMVYGEGCKGNYQTIVKIIKKSPIFPRINNSRSLIHVDNLNIFIKKAIDEELSGLFFPKDEKDVCTMDLARDIALRMGKKVYFSFLLGFFVRLCRPFSKTIKKAFGNLIYKI